MDTRTGIFENIELSHERYLTTRERYRMKDERNRVCPVELAGGLDNKMRRWIQNPRKILEPFIKEGMRVLDVGCGPGFFTIEIANMVGDGGRVFAADIQEGMLQKIKDKTSGSQLEKRIQLIKCEQSKINAFEKVDFVLCFYMVHEVPDKNNFFRQLKDILFPDGKILIIEPSFHVSKMGFEHTLYIAGLNGLSVMQGPKYFLNRTAVLKN